MHTILFARAMCRFRDCPVFGGGNPGDVEGGTLQGEALHLHCRIVRPVFIARIKKKGHPTAPLNYVIYTNDFMKHLTTFSYSGEVVTPDQAPVSYQWVTFGIDPVNPSKPFEAQCTYLGFQTDSGHPVKEDPGCDDCYLVSEVGNSGDLANSAEMSFDGGAHLSRAAYSTDGGKTWLDKFEWDANIVILGPDCIEPQKLEGISIPTPQPLPKELNQ